MRCHTFFFAILFLIAPLFSLDPSILYLTWKGDPSTTMMVMWHTTGEEGPSVVYYKTLEQTEWDKKSGSEERVVDSNVTVHQVELKGLEPETLYLFHLEGGKTHRFRTLPNDLSHPLKIAIGGDGYFSEELFSKMNKEVASHSPDFAILAGDIAYTEGLRTALRPHYWRVERWETFFELWTKDMVTSDGRIIPIVPVIGNHDVKEGFDNPYKTGVMFYQFFAFPDSGKSYRTMRIGDELIFYLLDSGHTYPIGGAQAEWLKNALKRNQQGLYHVPVYHIGAYPSVTAYSHRGSCDIRKFWCPLFEKYGVKVSMEHDSHAFKRTFPIKEGKVNHESGIQYLGDGAWGVFPDKPHRHWYLAKALQSNCYWLFTVDRSSCKCVALDLEGSLLDSFQISPVESQKNGVGPPQKSK